MKLYITVFLMLFAALLLFKLPSHTYPGQLTDGQAAFDRRDFKVANWLLEPLANHGNTEAEYLMGLMYYNGQGVTRNAPEAMEWYRKAADQENVKAEVELGKMYEVIEGDVHLVQYYEVSVHDNREAMKWFLKAAGQGSAEAEYEIAGLSYPETHGIQKTIPPDPPEAAKWRQKAAEDGYAEAQYTLGVSYRDGRGDIKQDYAKALMWYQRAANQHDQPGSINAQDALGGMYEKGLGVKQDYARAYMWYSLMPWEAEASRITAKMTPEQIAEGKRLAAEWKLVMSQHLTLRGKNSKNYRFSGISSSLCVSTN